MKQTFNQLGKRHKLQDGAEKILGRAHYAADVQLPGMLHARLLLSPYAHAKILGIDSKAAKKIPGVIGVFSSQDLVTHSQAINSRNSAVLAQSKAMWCGQPVAVVVASSEAIASDAAQLVEIDYEQLPAIANPTFAATDQELVWPHGLAKNATDAGSAHGAGGSNNEGEKKPSNIATSRTTERGDVNAAFKNAEVTSEREYTNNWVHQNYLEPHACVAEPTGDGLIIYTSTQGQFDVRNGTAKLLNMPASKIKVVPMVVGGGFGAKYGIIEPLVGALALKLNAPVRLVLSRSEDFQTTMPSFGSIIKLKTAASKDGTLLAIDAEVLLDTGLFPSGFGGIVPYLMSGYYNCENTRIKVTEVLTHKNPAGAYRAPGAPQTSFALESNMDDMARALNIDPIEFRLKNASKAGTLSGSGQPWSELGIEECLAAMQQHPSYKQKKQTPNNNWHEGVGIAIGLWPGAFSPASAICRVDNDGGVRLQVGSVDISGVHSTLILVAAETLGLEPENIRIVQGNTDSGPFAPPSGGSQVTVSVSGAVQDASTQVADQLLKLAAKELEAAPEDLELKNGQAQVRGVPSKGITIGKLAQKAESQAGGTGPIVAEGKAAMKSGAPGVAVHLVRVRVNTETGQVQPTEYLAIQDVGFAMNPTLIEGQMHGGAAQGLGWGLFEAMRYENGQNLSSNYMEYHFPRAQDIPNIETMIVEKPSESGPFGARVVGEPPIIPGGAAIANAIFDAVGVRVTELPVKPETLWKQIHDK